MLAVDSNSLVSLFQNISDQIPEIEKKLNQFHLSEFSQFIRTKFGIHINVFSVKFHEIIESKFSYFLLNNQDITKEPIIQEHVIKIFSKLYVKLVLYYNLQVTKVVSLLWHMVGSLNSGKVLESKPISNNTDTTQHTILFTSTHSIHTFLKYCLNAFAVPILRQLGSTVLYEFTQTNFIQNHMSHLISTLTTLTSQQIDDDDSSTQIQSQNTSKSQQV